MPASTAPLEVEQLAAALRGTPDVHRQLAGDEAQARFLEAAAQHRVRPLLAWTLRTRGEWDCWPEPIRRGLRASERAEAAIEIVRRRELARVAGVFDAAGIPILVIKGAAFAYSLYPEPWLRPRQDTDLLIAPDHAAEGGRALERAGYQPDRATAGDLISHQRNYVRHDELGLRHDYDVHWKPSNPVAIADLLTFSELLRHAEPLEDGGVRIARTPQRVDALAIACLHRASHHFDSADLLWLYDIHLIAGRLSEEERGRLTDLARRTGAGAVCARGLRLARDRFGTPLPDEWLDALGARVEGQVAIPGVYLDANARKADLLRADLAALPDWRARIRLVKEHLFPPADYMRSQSVQSARWPLPLLYARRILRGARGWFRPAGRSES